MRKIVFPGLYFFWFGVAFATCPLNRLPYIVSFFSILIVVSVSGGSVGAAVVTGTTIPQSGPA